MHSFTAATILLALNLGLLWLLMAAPLGRRTIRFSRVYPLSPDRL
ncbi:hypothetical protein [Gellertiella hungarica]|uniref:Uncharacterized protein n=1 Tax=Gellertiella hungarica TaxID=1572859 RepID=A0A7W6J4Y7_9HYPH|nr:hypothetical protein [Gellertiella hungarica]MBB4064894.1 hypothetical protein [Gellertiella hungarica]